MDGRGEPLATRRLTGALPPAGAVACMGVRRGSSFLLAGALAGLLAFGAPAAGGASASHLELRSEGKALAKGATALFVGGYSLDSCYSEEQEMKVAVTEAGTDRLVRTGESGTAEGCTGGIETLELTATHTFTAKFAPLRIHLEGPCVYELGKLTGSFQQRAWGVEAWGTATGALSKRESAHSGCARTRRTEFDIGLSGVETAVG